MFTMYHPAWKSVWPLIIACVLTSYPFSRSIRLVINYHQSERQLYSKITAPLGLHVFGLLYDRCVLDHQFCEFDWRVGMTVPHAEQEMPILLQPLFSLPQCNCTSNLTYFTLLKRTFNPVLYMDGQVNIILNDLYIILQNRFSIYKKILT